MYTVSEGIPRFAQEMKACHYAPMWNRAPLALAAGLFILGAAGLLATAADPWETTAYLGFGRSEPTPAPLDMRSAQAPVLPGNLPLAPPTVTMTAEPVAEHHAAVATPLPTAIPTPTPRPPLFIGAVASDEAHELATPTPGPRRAIMIGRDDGEMPGDPGATPVEPATTPVETPTPAEMTPGPSEASATPEATPEPAG